MARRRTAPAVAVDDVRPDLAAKYRRLAVRYAGIGTADTVPPWSGRFADLADALETGEPVTLYAWQLPSWLPNRPRSGRVLVTADGAVVRL